MQRHFEAGWTAAVAALVAMGGWTLLPAEASAQPCPDDAATCASDAGAPPGDPVPDAGPGSAPTTEPDEEGFDGDICSCETLLDDDGTLHVCTDSYERAVCATFSCNRGTERARPCPRRGVHLCCEMPDEGTQSRLYDDCTHPNCESGFRDQCREFGGTIHEGDCDVSRSSEPHGDANSLCAVSAPGGARRTASGFALLALACLITGLRRSR
jgi:hypothetical protein